MIILEPDSYDVVELVDAETDEVIQALSLQRTDERLGESVRHRGRGGILIV